MARKEDRFERLRVSRYTGLDLNTAKLHMDEGAGRITNNFDFRRIGAARVRAGYSRLYVANPHESQVATDDFNRADGSLGANWTDRGGTALAIASNQVRLNSTSTNVNGMAERVGTYAADQYSKVKVKVTPVNASFGVVVRSSASAGYLCSCKTNLATIMRVTSWTGPSSVSLGAVKYIPVVGDVVALWAYGDSIRLYVNGALRLSVTDTVLTSGKPGIVAFNLSGVITRPEMDDWEGGNIVLLQEAVIAQDRPSRIFAFERDDDETRLIVTDGTRMEQFGETLPEWGT